MQRQLAGVSSHDILRKGYHGGINHQRSTWLSYEEVGLGLYYITFTSLGMVTECCMCDGYLVERKEYTREEVVTYSYHYTKRGSEVCKNGNKIEEYFYNANGQRICDYLEWAGGNPRAFVYNGKGEVVEADNVEYIYHKGCLAQSIIEDRTMRIYYTDDLNIEAIVMYNGEEITYDFIEHYPSKKYVNGMLVEEYLWSQTLDLEEYIDYRKQTQYRFFYDGGRIPERMCISGRVAEQYFCSPSLHCYFGYDHCGTIKRVYSEDGTIIKTLDYDSFGNISYENALDCSIPFGFAGGLRDRDSQFITYMYGVYYPYIGRLICTKTVHGDCDMPSWHHPFLDNPMTFVSHVV